MADTEWFYKKKWGIFVHHLYGGDVARRTERGEEPGEPRGWLERLECFDAERLAKQLHEIGAGYFCITLQQQSQYLLVPSLRHAEITGYKPGTVMPESRDIVEELYAALSKYCIDLMLYFTGDGPLADEQAGNAYGYTTHAKPVTVDFVRKWGSVLEELSVRYGKKVKGWWLDGCHPCIEYDEEKWGILKSAILKGNPDAIVAFNASVVDRVKSFSPLDDYTAGERNAFDDIPDSRFTDGKQWHIFSFLGYHSGADILTPAWAAPRSRYSADYMHDFVSEVTSRGGVVTIDVSMDDYGNIDSAQLEVLRALKNI